MNVWTNSAATDGAVDTKLTASDQHQPQLQVNPQACKVLYVTMWEVLSQQLKHTSLHAVDRIIVLILGIVAQCSCKNWGNDTHQIVCLLFWLLSPYTLYILFEEQTRSENPQCHDKAKELTIFPLHRKILCFYFILVIILSLCHFRS